MQYRARVNVDPVMLAVHVEFDTLLGLIIDLENQHGVLQALLPGGAWASNRKPWSWQGVRAPGTEQRRRAQHKSWPQGRAMG